ncbi:hypothetical protein TTHERM_00148850 (macronuclear) [Tetrahymena thermophila SB210]|uniref:Scp-like extracellular protein n=1 Tax=Tetrahymena thermophila (strain SB210) TaxID=312017 RepID=I7LWA7_TETTS|nr:hypothetical protein TTHERM_00148850 [Tetrahymena thermophila SB210]EAS01275.2 hypothetical protein TTHERM_00148850 [Tetrahymena thermophila SB210]|eukprot:XP_001021520.2 hypothetical protein TTHERM_00148850 [Tetrahymena thermophila SB210]
MSKELSLKGVPFISLDVNYDSLKSYLEEVHETINAQNDKIEKLEQQMKQKIAIDQIQHLLRQVTKCTDLYDEKMAKEMKDQVNEALFYTGAGIIDKELSKLCEKINLLSMGTTQAFKQVQTYNSRIEKLEQKIDSKLDSKNYKEKQKQFKEKLIAKIDDFSKVVNEDTKAIEQRVQVHITNFEELVQDVERRTIWKIQDCQDLLTKRINEEYVQETVQAMQQKIMKEFQNLNGGSGERNDKFQERLNQKVDEFINSNAEKQKLVKASLKELETQIKQTYVTQEKLNEYQKINNDRISEMRVRMKTLEGQFNIQATLEDHKSKFVQIEHRFEEFNILKSKIKETQNQTDEIQDYSSLLKKMDPHKICQLESDLKRAEEEIAKLIEAYDYMTQEVKRKFDGIDLITQVNQAHLGHSDIIGASATTQLNIGKAEIQKMIDQSVPKGILDEEKYKKLQKDLNEIHYKVETANEIEKRVMRVFRDADLNGLVKQVKLKLNSEEYRKELALIDSRLNQLSEQQSFLRRDCDNLSLFVKKQMNSTNNMAINNFMSSEGMLTPSQGNQNQNNSLLSTKKLIPVKCLSCGQNKGNNHVHNHERYSSIGKNINESLDYCFTSPDDNRVLNLSSTNGTTFLQTPNKKFQYSKYYFPSSFDLKNQLQ